MLSPVSRPTFADYRKGDLHTRAVFQDRLNEARHDRCDSFADLMRKFLLTPVKAPLTFPLSRPEFPNSRSLQRPAGKGGAERSGKHLRIKGQDGGGEGHSKVLTSNCVSLSSRRVAK